MVSTTAQAAAIAMARTSHSDIDHLRERAWERGLSAAADSTAGAVTSSMRWTMLGPPGGGGALALR